MCGKIMAKEHKNKMLCRKSIPAVLRNCYSAPDVKKFKQLINFSTHLKLWL